MTKLIDGGGAQKPFLWSESHASLLCLRRRAQTGGKCVAGCETTLRTTSAPQLSLRAQTPLWICLPELWMTKRIGYGKRRFRQLNGLMPNRRSAPLRCVEYLTDDGPDPLDGGDGPHYRPA